jgi:hypothetical protein
MKPKCDLLIVVAPRAIARQCPSQGWRELFVSAQSVFQRQRNNGGQNTTNKTRFNAGYAIAANFAAWFRIPPPARIVVIKTRSRSNKHFDQRDGPAGDVVGEVAAG